jgi:hypothetical protein
MMHYGGSFSLRIGPEENRCAADTLDCRDKSPILGTALLHAKGIEHFRRTPELDRLALLANG